MRVRYCDHRPLPPCKALRRLYRSVVQQARSVPFSLPRAHFQKGEYRVEVGSRLSGTRQVLALLIDARIGVRPNVRYRTDRFDGLAVASHRHMHRREYAGIVRIRREESDGACQHTVSERTSAMFEVSHWCGVHAICAPKRPPMLEFYHGGTLFRFYVRNMLIRS